MNNRAILFIFVVSVLGVSNGNASQTELDVRSTLMTETRNAFMASQFSALETASGEYRTRKSRTPSGLWKLSFFYDGIADAVELKQKDSSEHWAGLEARAANWIRAYPNSPSAHIAYAKLLIWRAWQIRGRGYAASVKKDAWAPFFELLERSRRHLEQYKRVANIDPDWYATMLDIAYAQGWDRKDFNALFEEAVSKEPGYYNNYFNALMYLLPKWNGNIREMDALVRQTVAKTQQIEGKGMYARMYWAAADHYPRDLFAVTLANWSEMSASFDEVLVKYPDGWNLNNFAKFACLAKDKKKTKDLIGKIGASPIPSAWPVANGLDPLALYKYCQKFAESDH